MCIRDSERGEAPGGPLGAARVARALQLQPVLTAGAACFTGCRYVRVAAKDRRKTERRPPATTASSVRSRRVLQRRRFFAKAKAAFIFSSAPHTRGHERMRREISRSSCAGALRRAPRRVITPTRAPGASEYHHNHDIGKKPPPERATLLIQVLHVVPVSYTHLTLPTILRV